MVVSLVVSLGGSVQVGLSFGQSDSLAVCRLGLLHARVDPALIALEVELLVLSFLDGLPQHLDAVFGVLSGLDHLSVDHADVLGQIVLQFLTLASHARCTSYGMLGGFDRLVALVVGSCTDNRLVKALELVEEASLVSEDGVPCFPPCSGGLNDLADSQQEVVHVLSLSLLESRACPLRRNLAVRPRLASHPQTSSCTFQNDVGRFASCLAPLLCEKWL